MKKKGAFGVAALVAALLLLRVLTASAQQEDTTADTLLASPPPGWEVDWEAAEGELARLKNLAEELRQAASQEAMETSLPVSDYTGYLVERYEETLQRIAALADSLLGGTPTFVLPDEEGYSELTPEEEVMVGVHPDSLAAKDKRIKALERTVELLTEQIRALKEERAPEAKPPADLADRLSVRQSAPVPAAPPDYHRPRDAQAQTAEPPPQRQAVWIVVNATSQPHEVELADSKGVVRVKRVRLNPGESVTLPVDREGHWTLTSYILGYRMHDGRVRVFMDWYRDAVRFEIHGRGVIVDDCPECVH